MPKKRDPLEDLIDEVITLRNSHLKKDQDLAYLRLYSLVRTRDLNAETFKGIVVQFEGAAVNAADKFRDEMELERRRNQPWKED